MNNKSGSESEIPWLKPCGHEPPQGASQLHGVCLFCYRDRLAHLQKLCEEQRSDNETLKNENELLIRRFNDTFGQFYGMDEQLRHVITTERERADKLEVRVRELDARVEEQKGEIAGWVSLVKQIGLKVNCLYSNFADDNGHILKAIDSVQSQLATQTERVKKLTEALRNARYGYHARKECVKIYYLDPDPACICGAEQALKQESLGEGK